jgi:DNA-binding response OmpR family regulator
VAEILFVDDERAISAGAKRVLERHGHLVRTASTIASAQRCVRKYRFDAAFIDVWLGFSSGLDLYDWLVVDQPRLRHRVTFVTGDIRPSEAIMERLRASGRVTLPKPFGSTELVAAVDMMLSVRNHPEPDRPVDRRVP